MLFSCTPGVLVTHILGALAVADSLSLADLWRLAASHADAPHLDNLQKNIVWRSLAAGQGLLLFTLSAGGMPVVPAPDLAYGDLLLHGAELDIFLYPTEECQFRYLTGTANYQVMKTNLGDMPFRLLIVIARHGAAGVLNPELARESGQDARSLRLRLQKLEAANLIVCRNVYADKKHTTHSVHVKFAQLGVAAEYADHDDDLDTSRDVGKLKQHIIAALKAAPNQLRGFSDLRKEFKLDGSRSATKFFRSVCIKLHSAGYIEKLHVELPETKQRLYAIRFVKDLPKDVLDMDDLLDINDAERDNFDDSDADDDVPQAPDMPVFNKVFLPFHQIYQQIYARKDLGITSGEANKNLMGIADYRPYTRLYELLPSYLSNSKSLKYSKKYPEPYDNYSVSKLYDNEGKLKFFRYYVTEFRTEDKQQPKPFTHPKPAKESIVQLSKKYASLLGKTSNKSLLEKKRKMVQLNHFPLKKKRASSDEIEEIGLSSQPETDPNILPRQRRSKAPKTFATEDTEMAAHESEDDYNPGADAAAGHEPVADFAGKVETSEDARRAPLSANDLPQFVVAPKQEKSRKSKPTSLKSESSLKSLTRRNHLLDILREGGGVCYMDASLCRKLDNRMGNTTQTDGKTLARDIKYLCETNVLEHIKVSIDVDGKLKEKKLVLFASPDERPSADAIEELKARYAELQSKKNMKIFKKRLIQSDMKLYVEVPNEKKAPVRKSKGKNRLQALGDEDELEASPVKTEDVDGVPLTNSGDVFSSLKRARRARKVVSSQASEASLANTKRPRRSIKMEKSDATLLYRSVVISKAFFRDAIDFERIAVFFDDLDGKLIRQKWGTLRRLYGGAEAVSKGVETFQNMVLQGIEDGLVTEKQLLDADFEFFLEFWKKFDTSTEFLVPDEMPLYSTFEQNAAHYNFSKGFSDGVASHWERIEDISMRQKEAVLGQLIFASEPNSEPTVKQHDELRLVLKSIFSTKEDNFDPNMVKTILNKYGESAVREATDGLLHDREILYISLENNTRFVLSDKFNNTFQRTFTTNFFKQAAAFKNLLTESSAAGKGLILSLGVMPGEMACLLELLSDGMAELTRVDRTFRFENYESRLIDKEQIACDIIVLCDATKVKALEPKVVPIPYEAPCRPVWVDLNAEVNKSLWTKIIVTILYHIALKPGIRDAAIYDKMQVVLSLEDYHKVLRWLEDSNCITKTPGNGYVATNCWQYILG